MRFSSNNLNQFRLSKYQKLTGYRIQTYQHTLNRFPLNVPTVGLKTIFCLNFSQGKEALNADGDGDIKIVGKPLEAEDSKDSFGEKEDGDLEESSNQNEDDDDDEEDNNKVVEIEDLPAEATRVDNENKAQDETEDYPKPTKKAEPAPTQFSPVVKEKEDPAPSKDEDDGEDEVLKDLGTSLKENPKNDQVFIHLNKFD